jgi:hypothetical protein
MNDFRATLPAAALTVGGYALLNAAMIGVVRVTQFADATLFPVMVVLSTAYTIYSGCAVCLELFYLSDLNRTVRQLLERAIS